MTAAPNASGPTSEPQALLASSRCVLGHDVAVRRLRRDRKDQWCHHAWTRTATATIMNVATVIANSPRIRPTTTPATSAAMALSITAHVHPNRHARGCSPPSIHGTKAMPAATRNTASLTVTTVWQSTARGLRRAEAADTRHIGGLYGGARRAAGRHAEWRSSRWLEGLLASLARSAA